MGVRALLLSLTLLLAAAPAATAQDQVSAAVEDLQDGSVHVASGVAPRVAADFNRVREEIAKRGLELKVAVLPAGADAEKTAAQIYDRLREVGTLAVVAGDEETGYTLVAGPSEAEQRAAGAAADANDGAGMETVLFDFIERLDAAGAAGDGASAGAEEDGVGAGALILLGLAGAGGAALVIGRRRRRREQAAEFAEVKDNARDDLVALGDEIRALDLDMQMPDVSGGAKTDYETAVNAYDRANRVFNTARRAEDLEPVGEALEEGRWAMLSARARLDGREPPERRSPCFFDPRHGPSSREVEWAPEGGAPRMVPACEADAQRVDRGEDPEAREVTVGGQRVPYWSAGPAYAPFMGGFFGAGILPGLMVGTLLGGAWSEPAGDSGGADAGEWGGGDFGGGDFGGGDFGG